MPNPLHCVTSILTVSRANAVSLGAVSHGVISLMPLCEANLVCDGSPALRYAPGAHQLAKKGQLRPSQRQMYRQC